MFRSCGILTLALALLLTPAAAQAKWLRAESPHFIVYGATGKSALRGYVQMLEEFDRVLRRIHTETAGLQGEAKLEVFLVGDMKDVRRVIPTMRSTTAGVYVPSVFGIFAVAFRPTGDFSDYIVKHEYYHHFMMQHFAGAYPAWMVEGLAEFFSTTRPYGDSVWAGAAPPDVMAVLSRGFIIPLDEVLTKSVFEIRDVSAFDYYAEAWALTNYMMTDAVRRKQLGTYLAGVRAGEASVKAWTEATGETPIETQRKVRAYVSSEIKGMRLPKDDKQTVEVAISTMPASADDLLLAGQELKLGVPVDRAPALLTRIRTVAAKRPGDRLSNLVHAWAELIMGDKAVADTLLQRLIDADANDLEPRLLLAVARMKAADGKDVSPERRTELYRDADRILVPALKTNADDFRLLSFYAESRSVEPGYPSDNMLAVLRNSVALAPQVPDLRFTAAEGFARRGDYDTAIGLLLPLAANPHDHAVASKAADEVADFKARKAKAAAKPKG